MNPSHLVVDDAIASRRSIRRFLPDAVPEAMVREILSIAGNAPSGTNMQPWRVMVLAGERKSAVSRAALAEHHQLGGKKLAGEYEYYPEPFPEPYLTRRRKVGWGLYGSLGIEKGDSKDMHEQSGRNFLFFDAPVGLIFTVDRVLKIGSWLDYGAFLQSIAIAARGRGLDTCIQAAFARVHGVLRNELGIPQTQVVVCGMSMGYAVKSAPENTFPIDRVPLDEFATFNGF